MHHGTVIMARLPIFGRISLKSYIYISIQLLFAFTILLTEPIIRLLFFLFPFLDHVAELVHKHILSLFHANAPATEASKQFESLQETRDFCLFQHFPFESHFCETRDGFLLNLHRIPGQRNRNIKNEPIGKKPCVLLWHGFLMCSEVWVCRPDTLSNLAFYLAEMGKCVFNGQDTMCGWFLISNPGKYSRKQVFK